MDGEGFVVTDAAMKKIAPLWMQELEQEMRRLNHCFSRIGCMIATYTDDSIRRRGGDTFGNGYSRRAGR